MSKDHPPTPAAPLSPTEQALLEMLRQSNPPPRHPAWLQNLIDLAPLIGIFGAVAVAIVAWIFTLAPKSYVDRKIEKIQVEIRLKVDQREFDEVKRRHQRRMDAHDQRHYDLERKK